ncbi:MULTISPECIES: branched-chain amino acid ABC transporter permease [unclassified Streptomyces]|uniref:Branched-chain amino acid ABC transporter permease n=1 Tax=Streptomyces sp. NBC_00180 TaxID=2903632 RepID=A0AAU1ICC7_9ACTN|nr:branched-chain amino acid ABC transporter permease [Streptomyces sp. NBC_01017]WSV34949.1 branched-chain amino acid ABC transporter permease [Streptomyces sp. NBC_01017]
MNLILAGLTEGFVLAAVALAVVLILRTTQVINFAQGSMLMLTTFIAWTVLQHSGSYWLSLITALVSGLVLGAAAERFLIRWVEGRHLYNSVILTFGLLIVLEAVAGMIWGSTLRSYPTAFSVQGFTIGGARLLLSPADLFTVGAVCATLAALVVMFRFSAVGLRMRATAYEPEIAQLLGVRVNRMLTLGWALAAMVGALAGVLVAPTTSVGPSQFDPVLIYGFTAAVIGGLESPVGAVVGGIVLGCVLSLISGYASPALGPLATFGFLIAVLAIRPAGLFGSAAGRKV